MSPRAIFTANWPPTEWGVFRIEGWKQVRRQALASCVGLPDPLGRTLEDRFNSASVSATLTVRPDTPGLRRGQFQRAKDFHSDLAFPAARRRRSPLRGDTAN